MYTTLLSGENWLTKKQEEQRDLWMLDNWMLDSLIGREITFLWTYIIRGQAARFSIYIMLPVLKVKIKVNMAFIFLKSVSSTFHGTLMEVFCSNQQ